MAGCYGNSAEDRHYEAMLDNYLSESESPSEAFGDQVDAIIEEQYNDPDSEFADWLKDNFCLCDNNLEEATIEKVLELLMRDKNARKAYHDTVFDDMCQEMAEDAADAEEAAREEAEERRMEYEREIDY